MSDCITAQRGEHDEGSPSSKSGRGLTTMPRWAYRSVMVNPRLDRNRLNLTGEFDEPRDGHLEHANPEPGAPFWTDGLLQMLDDCGPKRTRPHHTVFTSPEAVMVWSRVKFGERGALWDGQIGGKGDPL
jgi:hypothetical protein